MDLQYKTLVCDFHCENNANKCHGRGMTWEASHVLLLLWILHEGLFPYLWSSFPPYYELIALDSMKFQQSVSLCLGVFAPNEMMEIWLWVVKCNWILSYAVTWAKVYVWFTCLYHLCATMNSSFNVGF